MLVASLLSRERKMKLRRQTTGLKALYGRHKCEKGRSGFAVAEERLARVDRERTREELNFDITILVILFVSYTINVSSMKLNIEEWLSIFT